MTSRKPRKTYTVRLLAETKFQSYYGEYPCTILQQEVITLPSSEVKETRYFIEVVRDGQIMPGWVTDRAIHWRKVEEHAP